MESGRAICGENFKFLRLFLNIIYNVPFFGKVPSYLVLCHLFSVTGDFRLLLKNKSKEIQKSPSNKAGNKSSIILKCWVQFFDQREEEVMSVAHTIVTEKPQG